MLLGDALGRFRQGGRLSVLFSCKAVFLFIAGDPIVSAVNHTVKVVARKKEAPSNVQICCSVPGYFRETYLGRNGRNYDDVDYSALGGKGSDCSHVSNFYYFLFLIVGKYVIIENQRRREQMGGGKALTFDALI